MAVALESASSVQSDAIDDETRVIASGYVPPPAPPAPRRVARQASAPTRAPRRASRAPRRLAPLIGTVAVLAAAAAVVLFVVVPLLRLGGGASPGGSPSSAPVVTPAPGTGVAVPDLVGMPTADAVDAARDAGLDWTVHCAEDPAKPEGIIDQEPPAGTQVARGAPFNLYSARISDCR
jgi:hypothetical protein